jgi:NAD(P)-dependent dehydrogenase (short-subunit alcohol dehydrogenase family)
MSKPANALNDGSAVLVTGCSSGIGRQMAVTLADHGYVVFATVRKEADAEDLRGLGIANLVPVCPLDLADLGHVKRAAEQVTNELRRRAKDGLYALINNAGGGSPAPVELMDLEKFRAELHTRLLGSVAMVQAFLPLIRRANGRIVWIMTPALIPTPYVTSIHACDFAVNCIVRTLDIELKPWSIRNVMIRCGGIRTPAGLRTTSDVEAVLAMEPRERVSLYERVLRKWSAEMTEFDKKRTDPQKVAAVVLEALAARRPKRQYSVGYMATAARLLEAMPRTIADTILRTRF